MSDAGDVHLPQPWAELTPEQRQAWAGAIAHAVNVDRLAKTIVAAGTCPACGHGFKAVLTDADLLAESADMFGVDRGPRRPAWAGVMKFTIACCCTSEHSGRPSGVSHGCGASGPLKDTP